MTETFRRVQTLVLAGDVHVSDHGFEELRKDDILVDDVIDGIAAAIVVEEYPRRFRGPSILTLQHDANNRPLHVVRALPAGQRRPAVLVTAYPPDPKRWGSNFKQRKDDD
jgi:hypothetical protein